MVQILNQAPLIAIVVNIFVLAAESTIQNNEQSYLLHLDHTEPTETKKTETASSSAGHIDYKRNTGQPVSSVDEDNLPVGTKEQLKDICKHSSCRFASPDHYEYPQLQMNHAFEELPQVLSNLKAKGIKIPEVDLVFINGHNDIVKMTGVGSKTSPDCEFQANDGKSLQLLADYQKYITHNVMRLRLFVGTHLNRIDENFFSHCFPNLRKLLIYHSGYPDPPPPTPAEAIYLGFLPNLTSIDINYPINGELIGCALPEGEVSCFSNNLHFEYSDESPAQTANMTLKDLHLPEHLSMFDISLNRANLSSDKELEGRTIHEAKVTVSSTTLLQGLNFVGSHLESRFVLEGGDNDNLTTMARNMDGILKNPSIATKLYWKWKKDKLFIPVVFATSSKQIFQDMDGEALMNESCVFANDLITYSNDQAFSNEQSSKLTYRAIYVDLTLLIDDIKDKSRTISELHVTAFHVHVSASRNVTFMLHVSYMKVTTDNDAMIAQEQPGRQYHGYDFVQPVKSRGSSATEIRWRDSVDAIYTQAFQICTAMVTAQEKTIASMNNIESSDGYNMWSYQMPEILQGSDHDTAKAKQLITKVGEYVEYLLEAASQKAMRVPYLSLQYQQENIGILLYIAQSLADEKRSNKALLTMEEMRTDILDRLDQSTIALLETEYKRTVSLVLISARRAHDIQKKLNATIALVNEVSVTFDAYREEMQRENVTFMKGIKRAKAFAYAEVAAAITSSVVSFFSGGFDPGKVARAAKKLKDMAIKLKRLMNLTTIFAKLSKLIKTLKNIRKLSQSATKAISGRVGRLFTSLKNFKVKRDTYLMHLIRKSKAYPFYAPLLKKKKLENSRLIDKYTKILKRVRNIRNSVDYLSKIMEGIVDAEKAKVTLKNVIKPQTPSSISGTEPSEETVTTTDITEALQNEFMIASGDNKELTDELSEVLQAYSLDRSKDVVAEGEKLNAADVLEWDVANANVEGTMDASISMDIPETTSFKAALLKMNLAGKLKTQAMIDEAAIRVDLDRARFETTTYLREGAKILDEIDRITQEMKKRKSQTVKPDGSAIQKTYKQMLKDNTMQYGLKEFTVKLNILLASLSYCSAYYYFHLSPCPSEYSFDFGTSLNDIVPMQRELQRQSLLQLEDFYPPPQTMQNRSMVFKKPNTTCVCMKDVTRTTTDYTQLYGKWLHCASAEIQSRDTENKETRRLLQSLSRHCEVNKVLEMQEFKSVSIDVSINDSLAKDHSRVRIDDMKVILHGARTTSGVITMTIESSGLSEDRYGGEMYEFYGSKWRRDFAYFSPKSKIDSALRFEDQMVQDWNVLDAADVYRSFRGVYRTATLFTTWVIKVDPGRNPGLDLTHLHTIELRFSGSFVAAGDEKYVRNGDQVIEDETQPETPLRRKTVPYPDIVNYDESDQDWYSSI